MTLSNGTKCTSARLRDASTSIKKLLDSPYLEYMNNPKTAEMYWTLVDPTIEGEDDPKPRANFQKISACRALNSQQFFTALRCTEVKGSLMDNQDISRRVKHRIQVASQPGSGTASLVVPTEECLDMDDNATIQAVCCGLGLSIPGFTFASQMPAELHSNGTTRHTRREHSEREHHDWHTLLRLQVLWYLRQAQRSSASDLCLPQVRVEVLWLNQV